MGITSDEAQLLVNFRNDLIHGKEFFRKAVEKCDLALKDKSTRYLKDFDMQNSSTTVLNYVHSLSAETLMKIIGYRGETQKYFPVSGTSRKFREK